MIRNVSGPLAAGRALAAAALVMALAFGPESLAAPADGTPSPLLSPRDLTPEQAKPFRAARTVRLLVHESCEKPTVIADSQTEAVVSALLQASGLTVVQGPGAVADCEMNVDIKVLTIPESQGDGKDENYYLKVNGAVTLSAGGFEWSRRLREAESDHNWSYTPALEFLARNVVWRSNLPNELVRMISAARGASIPLLVSYIPKPTRASHDQFLGLLADEGKPVVKPLIAELRNGGNRRLVAFLRKLPTSAAGEMADRLANDRLSSQSIAALALGRIGDPEAVEPLVAALEDEGLVEEAVQALGAIRDPRGARPLLEVMLAKPTSKDKDNVFRAARDSLRCLWDPEVIAPLIEVLAHEDKSRRSAAAEAIGGWLDGSIAVIRWSDYNGFHLDQDGTHPIYPYLSVADRVRLQADAQVRAAATRKALAAAIRRALAENKNPRRIALLYGTAMDAARNLEKDSRRNPELKPVDWAVVEVPKFGRAAVPGLVALLKDADPLVRAGAAVALGQIGDRTATAPLVAIVCGDEVEPQVWAAAAVALGVLKDPAAVEPLIRELKNGDWFMERLAAYALLDIGDPRAVAALTAVAERDIAYAFDGHTDLSAAVALGKMDKSGVRLLVDAMRRPHNRMDFETALGRIGERAIGSLAPLLDDPDRLVRGSAANALGRMDSAKAMPLLLKALQDKEQYVRYNAEGGLLDNHVPEALAPLLTVADNSGEEEGTRIWVLEKLPRDPQSIGPLALILRRESCIEPSATILKRESAKRIAEAAALALGRIPDPKAVQTLAAYLKTEKNAGCRAAAATGLRESKGPAALAALLAALHDADAGVCRSAVESLGARGDLAALPALADLAEKYPEAETRTAAFAAIEAIERKNP